MFDCENLNNWNLDKITNLDFEFGKQDNSLANRYEFDIKIEEPKVDQEYTDFLLFCSLEIDEQVQFPEHEYNTSTKDKVSGDELEEKEQKSDDECLSSKDEYNHLAVPFKNNSPIMSKFLDLVREEITFRGVNEMVCEALDIKPGEEYLLDTPQIVRIKKRKTKDQLKALEEEFSKGKDWSKEFMNDIADKLKLVPSQVYKWHWDQICKISGGTPKRKEKKEKKKTEKKTLKTKRSRKRKSTNGKVLKNKKTK